MSCCERLFLTNGSACSSPRKVLHPLALAPTADFLPHVTQTGQEIRRRGGTFCPAFYFYSNMRQDTLAR